jgi:para-aminobenzoate synthetase
MTDPVPRFLAAAATNERCFWLDGGGSRDWSGRQSLVGWLDDSDLSLTYSAASRQVLRHQSGRSEVVGDDIFAVLDEHLADEDPTVHWVGYFGYAARPDLPASVPASGGVPDAVWMRARHVQLYNHADPSQIRPNTPSLGEEVTGRQDVLAPDEYGAEFAQVQEELHAGNSYEVNLTYRVDIESGLAPPAAYLRLRELNPAPYAGYLQHAVPGHEAWLLSSSPERYAVVDRRRRLQTKPIKGTTPRGATAEEDAAHRERLASDPKFRAENLMIVDLLRNDLAMVCEPGSVTVPELMAVESYQSVHQLVSTVRGRLRDDVTTVGALRSLFPAGSMTGAPKLRTMQIIEAVEATPRGAYAGAFGWLSGDGRADLGVVIRSLTTTGDGRWTLGTGGGITVRSDPAEEYAESRWKADRLLRVFV